MKEALLIVGHGSRSKEAQEIFQAIVEMVKSKVSDDYYKVDGAHMELAEPTIEQQVEKLAEDDVKRILMVPYFLYKGVHIKEDIPELIEKLSELYPSIAFEFGEPIGKEPLLADILISRAKQLK